MVPLLAPYGPLTGPLWSPDRPFMVPLPAPYDPLMVPLLAPYGPLTGPLPAPFLLVQWLKAQHSTAYSPGSRMTSQPTNLLTQRRL